MTHDLNASIDRQSLLIAVACALVGFACLENSKVETVALLETATSVGVRADKFGEAPACPTGPLADSLRQSIELAFGEGLELDLLAESQAVALEQIANSDDPRLAWIVSDLMRLTTSYNEMSLLCKAVSALTGLDCDPTNPWGQTTNHLIAWDIPAPPGYLKIKRNIYTSLVPEWKPLFAEGDIDWRHVSWGGVKIDDRPFGTTDDPCNCIPAADNPQVSSAVEAKWLDDDSIVFGVAIGDAYRAYPRRIMEVREMVNDTLGGRDIAMPYCTLCGSAQAYFTDQLPEGVERPILRTSGLLLRSNKVMFDLNTYSVFDTFRGHAVTGPLADKGIVLEQAGVVTTTWAEWKRAHPTTTVLVEGLALGRDFNFRENRDADGPIFPVGDVDPRLPVQADVLGVIAKSGTAIAFHNETALAVLRNGDEVRFEEVRIVLDAGGLRAVDTGGNDLGGHLAFWFAWSQFHPNTKLWQKAD
ncbi:MAG: hypothetical protein ACI8TQ_000494 [Planctomycetota bacterium]|jgi:hypothetical protein